MHTLWHSYATHLLEAGVNLRLIQEYLGHDSPKTSALSMTSSFREAIPSGKASAAALQMIALDPRFIGGRIGMIGILQTWTRDLFYHPHIHYIIPGGRLSKDEKQCLAAKGNFLVHVKALSIIFRAKFRDALQKADRKIFEQIPENSWNKNWVSHCEAVGNGEKALQYLSEYLHRVAIANHRIVQYQDDQVTFRYKDPNSCQQRYQTLSTEEFIRRFLPARARCLIAL